MGELLDLVIVDDEQRVTRSLERELRLEFGDVDFSINCFTDPILALSFVSEKADSVFLVISDLRMPEMNGDILLEKIRGENPDVQTILLTAYTDLDSIRRAVASSIQALLFKPWDGGEVAACVRKALSVWRMKKENVQLSRRIDGLLKDAGEFQQRLFSADIPGSAEVDFSVFFLPHEQYHCGGDFYEIRRLPDRYLALVGDVSGHGPKPAMIAGMVKTIIEMSVGAESEASTNPGEVLSRLNRLLCDMLGASPETLIAVSALEIALSSKTVSIATAGLPPAVLVSGGHSELLLTAGEALGSDRFASYRTVRRTLGPGDMIGVYTDGLVESVPSFSSTDNETLCRAFTEFAAGSPDGSASALAGRLREKLPEKHFTDDATLMLARFCMGKIR